MSTAADDRVALLAGLPAVDLEKLSAHYLESSNVGFDCDTRLDIAGRLRDIAELKRMYGEDDGERGNTDG